MNEFSDDTWLYEGGILTQLERPDRELAAVEVYDCTIRAARLGRATLRRWVFEDCRFEDCDLSNARLDECVFQRCVFSGCRLIGIDWRLVSKLSFDASFQECNLSLSNFSELSLVGFEFTQSDCSEVDFSKSDLSRARFASTVLTGAIFAQTQLEEADLSQAIDTRIDPLNNRVVGARFSVEAAVHLAESFGLSIPDWS